MTYICPVCGYNQLLAPPSEYTICPSCGTEFEYDDFTASHAELRQRWIAAGMPWHSRRLPPPPGWNPVSQLLRAGYNPLTSHV